MNNINSIIDNYIKKPDIKDYVFKNNFLTNNQKKYLKNLLVYSTH